jgi:transcriptional regulator with XRE-family HTH domain
MGRQGVSQAMLADRLGCTQRMLSRRLTGDVAIETDLLEGIAGALDVPVTNFLPTPARAA